MSNDRPQYDPTHNPWAYGAPVPHPGDPILPTKTKTRLSLGLSVALSAAALVVGLALGAGYGSAASGAPVPAETVTVEVPAEVDAGCGVVAEELYSMLALATEDVMIEQNDIMSGMLDAFLEYDVDALEALVPRVEGVTDTVGGLTERLAAVQPEYQRCVNP